MKIFFNSTFKEIERDASDLWVKGNTGNRLEAYFEELDLTNANINARLTIEWGNGKTTTEIPMNKSFGFKYVYLTLPTLLESGEVKFTIGIYQNETLLQTAIFTRKIKASVEASDKVPIDATEYEALMNLIEDLNNNREISLTNIDGKPALLSKEELDLVSEEVVLENLDTLIEQLTRLNDKNLFDPTGNESIFRYQLKHIDDYIVLLENEKILNKINIATLINNKIDPISQTVKKLNDDLINIDARVNNLEFNNGGGTSGEGTNVDLTRYPTFEQARNEFASKNAVDEINNKYDELSEKINTQEDQISRALTTDKLDKEISSVSANAVTNMAVAKALSKKANQDALTTLTSRVSLLENQQTNIKSLNNTIWQFNDTLLPPKDDDGSLSTTTHMYKVNFESNNQNYVAMLYYSNDGRITLQFVKNIENSDYDVVYLDQWRYPENKNVKFIDGEDISNVNLIADLFENARLLSEGDNNSSTTNGKAVKIFGGESNMSDFSNFDATKGGFILFYGILENEEYDGRFQMLVPLTQEFINGTDSANGLDTFMLVYGDLLSAGTEVAINIDGKNNSFRGFMCQNCYVLDAFHIY